jgi:predicted lipoprotein with Yx(FWY)xxD motif
MGHEVTGNEQVDIGNPGLIGRYLVAVAAVGFSLLAEAAPEPPAAANVALRTQGHGWVITDSADMTLYTYARDIEPGVSSCVANCAQTWPPYLAGSDASQDGDWTLISRENGDRQWAYAGKPLYRYSVDEAAGDTYGEGVRAQWSLAFIPLDVPPGVRVQKTLLGYVAADRNRMTLYVPAAEVDPTSLCLKQTCGSDWSALLAPGAANDLGEWTVVTRQDGMRQWAYQGRPLFTYANDVHPRETNGGGQEIGSAGVARVALLEPRPPYPDWVTVQDTDAGQMLANEQGKTIYTHNENMPLPFFVVNPPPKCESDCLAPEWEPLIAGPDAQATGGNWAITVNEDGSRQWAYKGKRVYTNTRDKTQGSFLGYRHGGNRAWNVIMHSEDALVGTLRPP